MVHLKIKIKRYTWQLKKDTSSSDLYIVSSTNCQSWKGVYLSHFFQFQNNNNNIVNTKNNKTNSVFTYEQQHALIVYPFFCSSKQMNTNLVKVLKSKTPFDLFIHNNRTHTEIALKKILFNWADQIGRPNDKFTYRNSGQNGPLPLILEIFRPETLFGKYIGKYHFLWYSSLASSSTPFF